jgi:hypothetical protein
VFNRCLLSLFTLVMCAGASTAQAGADDSPEAVGKHIYREGRLSSGSPLVATLASGLRLEGPAAACVTCHRRSGLGGAEGQTVIRPLTVPGFFAGQKNPRRYARRPLLQTQNLQYTEASFDRALREGVSSDGRALDPLMPRYALDATAISALRAYLSSVALNPSPGVTDKQMHFATIIAPDADPKVTEATLQVLEAMVKSRTSGTRSEKQRQRIGIDRMYVNWREWVLHEWKLSGPPGTWPKQLDDFYKNQPVFAILSGAGRRWQPIHDFCEGHEIPCLFPNVDVPGRPEPGGYNLYLSAGVRLEAEVMACHLTTLGRQGPVWQIRREDYRAESGALAFRQAWQKQGKGEAREIVLRGDDAIEKAFSEMHTAGPAAVVLWLDAADLDRLAQMEWGGDAPILSSGILLGDALPAKAQKIEQRLLIVWPYALPSAKAQQFDRTGGWLAARGIPIGDWRTQANTYLAVTLAGGAIVHLGNNYSREYLIERIEHGSDNALAKGAFPRIGLGPGQRYASKGAYLIRLTGTSLVAVGDWMIP